jgi:hypothetical protein
MSVFETGLKRNVNLRPRKDNDLLAEVKKFGLDERGNGDFSHFCRELMRDGLKYRLLVSTGQVKALDVLPMPYLPQTEPEEEENIYEKRYGKLVDDGMLAEGEVD